jgi:hypothetical protein
MTRYSGRVAEKAFSILCSEQGITCNEPREDDHGWDHVVEFRHVGQAEVSADRQTRLPAIFVQTKSHKGTGLEVRMKLSNALKLTQSPNPCFIVLASYSKAGERYWHAVHFWGELMSRVLERARAASRDGIPEGEFNRRWFSFTVGATDRQQDKDLLRWMKQTVRASGIDYASAKRALRDILGYAEDRLSGTIQFEISSAEELIDHQLGLTDSLSLLKFELRERRFGIDLKVPLPDLEGAGIAYLRAHPFANCEVRLVGPDGYGTVLKGEITAATVPGLPFKDGKARIRTPVLDIVWAFSGPSTVKLKVNTAERRSPLEIEQICRLISWGDQGPADMKVSVEDQRLLGAELSLAAQPDRRGYERLAILVEPLVIVSRHLTAKIPSISIEEVNEADGLEPFQDFIMGDDMRMRAELLTEDTVGTATHAIGYGLVSVGEWIFGALASWPVLGQSQEGTSLSLHFARPSFLERYAFHETDKNTLDQLFDDYGRHAGKPGALSFDNIMLRLSPSTPPSSS